MITLEVGKEERYDSTSNQFVYTEGATIRFEYSLKALYDWESKWKKAFLKGDLTDEEWFDFFMTMALDPIDEEHLTTDVQRSLTDYIQDTNTATTFSSSSHGGKSAKPKLYTSEEIYALMFSAGVDLEFESRNLNRLLVILKVINAFNSPSKKMSKEDVMKQNHELNRARRAKYNTKG